MAMFSIKSNFNSDGLYRFYVVMQIPNWFDGEVPGATKDNPFSLPEAYMASQHKNVCYYFLVKARLLDYF